VRLAADKQRIGDNMHMKNSIALTALILTISAAHAAPGAGQTDERDDMDARPMTVAVFGDWPYSQMLLDNSNLLIDSVNTNAAVRTVIHVGDIHSGSMPCTSAEILPPLAKSNPGWNQKVFGAFQKFRVFLIAGKLDFSHFNPHAA
jgi:hypothetical protein